LAQDQNVVHLAGTGDKIAAPLVSFALRGKPAAVAQLALNRAVGIGSVAAYWSNPVILSRSWGHILSLVSMVLLLWCVPLTPASDLVNP
jgi:hypothetical protein